MCKPHRCPHIALTGNVCVYCPGGPDSDFEYSTQAYTGYVMVGSCAGALPSFGNNRCLAPRYEPTSMRAIRARYNPYMQTQARVAQLRSLGHSVDKIEFIVMGGTFLSMDAEYRYVCSLPVVKMRFQLQPLHPLATETTSSATSMML